MREQRADYRRLSPLTPFVRGSLVFVAVLGATWRDIRVGEIGWVAVALGVVLLAGLVYGTASWLRTKYWIEGEELRIDTGVVTHKSRRIRIDRLQGIDVIQPLGARFFGLAELKMDVAGAGKAEGSLAFLPLAEAHELRELLLARRDLARGGVADQADAHLVSAPLLATLNLGTLLVSLALSAEMVGFLASGVAAVATALLAGSFAVLTGWIPIVGGLGLVLFRRLSGFHNFRVRDTPAGLQVTRGLFELSSQTIALARVQGVCVCEPLLWRPFGWARLDVSVAGSRDGGRDGEKLLATTVFPVCPRDEAFALAQHVLGGLDASGVALTRPPSRAAWLDPIERQLMAAGHDQHLVVSRSGLLHAKTQAVPYQRIQSLRIRQGPLQRRLGLADVLVDSPPGPVQVRLRNRDAAIARPVLEELAGRARAARRR